jgi:hypothetical protein
MTTEFDKELSAQDVLLLRLQHQRTADTSSSALVPGYKMYHPPPPKNGFTAIGHKMGNLYPGISTIEGV